MSQNSDLCDELVSTKRKKIIQQSRLDHQILISIARKLLVNELSHHVVGARVHICRVIIDGVKDCCREKKRVSECKQGSQWFTC